MTIIFLYVFSVLIILIFSKILFKQDIISYCDYSLYQFGAFIPILNLLILLYLFIEIYYDRRSKRKNLGK